MQIIRVHRANSDSPMRHALTSRSLLKPAALALGLLMVGGLGAARAEGSGGFLESIRRHSVVTSTVPANGDQNPYALVVAPVTAGKIQQGDVLVDNFNDKNNLQGLGTTIVDYNPTTRKMSLFAAIPRHLASCPGGVGLTTAMTMLKSGWVIVGSLPSQDGTTSTKGPGCLIVLDSQGNVAGTIAGANIDGPWGNMAVVDNGNTATLFVSMTGFDVGPPTGKPPVVPKATVLRIELSIPEGKPPVVTRQTVVASGLGEQADKDVFVIGPTGLFLQGDTLLVSDAVNNRVVAIPNATTRTDSAGIGREVTKDGLLKRPLAMTLASNGHLLVINGLNGQVVEIDPASGKQLYARWIDANKAQSPAGQRRPVRHRDDPGRRRLLLCGRRGQHARSGALTGKCPFSSRRGFLAAAGGLMAAAAPGASQAASDVAKGISPAGNGPGKIVSEPFHGPHQGGIVTALQNHTFFAALDLVAISKSDVADMLKIWSDAAARMTAGLPAQEIEADTDKPGADSGEDARPRAGPAHHHLRLRSGTVREGRQGSLRPRRASPGGAGGSAAVQRRPDDRGPHRRRPFHPGLLGRSAGGVPCGTPARAARL